MQKKATSDGDGNPFYGGEVFLDSVYDGVDRLQEDGGIAPELAHRPSEQLDPPPPSIPRRRINQTH